jgi:protein gp37
MNKQLPGIEWTHPHGRPGFTANPVKGCKHACRWRMPDGKIAICYAEAIAKKFPGKHYANGFDSLSFDPKELDCIDKLKEPSAIFMDSMSDLFGHDVPEEWIKRTLVAIQKSPWHIFFTLTKNPRRLLEFDLNLPNLWCGVSAPPTFMFGKELTVEAQRTWLRKALAWLAESSARIKWVSIEPLSFDCSELIREQRDNLDWAVVGAASDGARTHQPSPNILAKVLDALLGVPVFFKGNLSRKLLAEIGSEWREEYPAPNNVGRNVDRSVGNV